MLVLTASGVGHAMVSSAERELTRVDPFRGLPDNDRPADDGGEDLNILLIGTDSRDGFSEAERDKYHLGGVSCYCADTIMLVHLSADRERASVVSLPRDSYAELPAHEFAPTGGRHQAHADKLNAALSHGGPSLMVRTVERMTELRVDHYLEVDFASFMNAVDEIGGVEVCTNRRLEDDYSGLDLPAGSHTLDGATALAYVRARHVDGSSDLGRMERQQRFLAAFLDRAVSSGVLLNPARLSGTAQALLGSVRADPGFGAEEMLDLAGAMREFKPSDARFASVPLSDHNRTVPGIGSTVAWDQDKAGNLFAALREDRPLPDTDGDPPRRSSGADEDREDCS
ncbi:LCP family protein [Streptomyces sp. 6N223]|uniref:LCP family protein n=1 Tax=Streptomyces sp. 6N223 TaxID=3457412 RepID=UPI003FD35536